MFRVCRLSNSCILKKMEHHPLFKRPTRLTIFMLWFLWGAGELDEFATNKKSSQKVDQTQSHLFWILYMLCHFSMSYGRKSPLTTLRANNINTKINIQGNSMTQTFVSLIGSQWAALAGFSRAATSEQAPGEWAADEQPVYRWW